MEHHSNLDTLRWLKPGRDLLIITGWAFPAGNHGTEWVGLEVTSGEETHRAYSGVPRPDVAQAYPGHACALFSGFSVTISGEQLSFPLAIHAIHQNGDRLLLYTIEVAQVGPPPSDAPPGVAIEEAIRQRVRHSASSARGERPVLFISHDYAYAGAQLILLRYLRWLAIRKPFPFEILINVPRQNSAYASPTELQVLDGFRQLAPVHFLSDLTGAPENLPLIRAGSYSLLYANTSTLGPLLAALQPCPTPVLSHVYEMGFWIERRTGRAAFARQAACTHRFIACAQSVREVLIDRMQVPPEKIDVIYACASTERARVTRAKHTRASVRQELGIPSDTFVVQACGTFDWRKGAELFVPLCVALKRRLAGQAFKAIWIGDPGTQLVKDQFEHEVEWAGLRGEVELLPPKENLPWWMLAADVFALPSREDPFPMVMLEAGALGLPVVGFDGSGGVKEYAASGAGVAVPYLDLEAFADTLARLAQQPAVGLEMGERAAIQIAGHYDQEISFQQALDLVLTIRANPQS